MNMQDKSVPDTATMDAYRRQMMEMHRNAMPPPPIELADENWLDIHYPIPNVEQYKAALAPSAPPPLDFVGYLRVYAFTGGGAEPLAGARVIVTRSDEAEETVFANLTTDSDGFSPVIKLPSVDPALSLRPGDIQPYVAYTIRVTADGFQPMEHRNVPIYGNSFVTQPVAMIPILPGANADHTQEFTSGGPTNL